MEICRYSLDCHISSDNIITYLIGDKINYLPLPLKTLIMTGILVPLMVFVLLPLLRKILGNWLNK